MGKKKRELTEYEKTRSKHRATSDKHVLTVEVKPDPPVKDAMAKAEDELHAKQIKNNAIEAELRRIFHTADELWESGNHLTNRMQKRLDQMQKTKKYKGLQKAYGKAAREQQENDKKKASTEKRMAELQTTPAEQVDNRELKKLQTAYAKLLAAGEEIEARKAELGKAMQEMQEEYGITFEACRKFMEQEAADKGILSVFMLTRAEDIWKGVEAVLYGKAKHLNYRKRGSLPVIRAKQPDRAILLKTGNDSGQLVVCVNKVPFVPVVKKDDIFMQEELSAIWEFLSDPEAEEAAVGRFKATKTPQDTFRPCYCALKCETIRGKKRLFLQITVEGRPKPKKKKDGSPRHTYGKGRLGVDIGTQSYAAVGREYVQLDNLAERDRRSAFAAEKEEKDLARAMERSRRKTNPENYNQDGTVKKGRKEWYKSRRYRKLEKKYRNLARRNALSRKYAIQTDVNRLREHADEVYTEPKNATKLAKRAENPKPRIDKDGNERPGRKKRFGHSIRNRCPGYFQAELKKKFRKYYEVNGIKYRASQYDHADNIYKRKKLRQRWHYFRDGTKVQRDLYSAFLLYCANEGLDAPDRMKCLAEFEAFLKAHDKLVEEIRRMGYQICNSGIKAA